jgi:hypothetical protein
VDFDDWHCVSSVHGALLMGFFAKSGLESGFNVAALLLQDIVARSITLTQAASSVAVQLVTGARLKLGTGTTDYLTSDGSTTITAAGALNNAGNFNFGSGIFSNVGGAVTLGGSTTMATNVNLTGGSNSIIALGTGTSHFNVVNLSQSVVAPTVSAGAGASIVASNGTAAFEVNLGAAAQTGTITLPSATTGWVVAMYNITNPAANAPAQTGFTQTSATFTNFVRTTGVAGNWTANDHMICIAMAY